MRSQGLPALLAFGLLAACSPASPAPTTTQSSADGGAAPTLPETMKDYMGTAFSDFDAVAGTDAMAEMADVVFTGVVHSYAAGPTFGAADDMMADIQYTMVRLEGVTTIAGKAPGSAVYIYVWGTPEEVELAIPACTRTALYGKIDTWIASDDPTLTPPPGGVATDLPIYRMSRTQGMVFELASPEGPVLAWPRVGTAAIGSLEDALPGGALDGSPERDDPAAGRYLVYG